MALKRKVFTKIHNTLSPLDFDGTKAEVLAAVEKAFADCPENAVMAAEWDYDNCSFEIRSTQEESDEDFLARAVVYERKKAKREERSAQVAVEKEARRKEQEAAEIALYQTLRAKYGNLDTPVV